MRKLPSSYEGESGVLGCMILNPLVVIPLVKMKPLYNTSFYNPPFRKVYECLLEMRDKKIPIDHLSLLGYISDGGLSDATGGINAIDAIIDSISTVQHAEYFIDLVYRKHLAREGIFAYKEGVDTLCKAEDPTEAFMTVSEKVNKLVQTGVKERDVEEVNKSIINSWSRDGLLSRHLELNLIVKYDGMIVLGGRPSCGKTAHILDETHYWCDTLGLTVCGASLEMSEEKIRERMAGRHAETNTFKLWRGDGSEGDKDKVIGALDHMKSWDLFLSDSPMSCEQFCAWAKSVAMLHKPDVIWVDYLQLFRCSDADWRIQPEQRVARWSSMLKDTQKELGIPLIVLSQLSRGDGSAPTLASLRYSGAIEQDADVVIFVYKDPGADPESFRGTGEWCEFLDVQKQRNGGIDRLAVTFDREYQRFKVDKRLDIFDKPCDTVPSVEEQTLEWD